MNFYWELCEINKRYIFRCEECNKQTYYCKIHLRKIDIKKEDDKKSNRNNDRR